MEKSEVLDLIRRESVVVEFVKVNGEIRSLTCTLDPEILPKQKTVVMEQQDKQPDIVNHEYCAVFDTVNLGWRSFRWDSVLTVNGEAFIK